MEPIRFACQETIAYPAEGIARLILDLSLWPQFQGYGLLPGIRSASFERQTPDTVGSRIGVVNTDGSTHVEEILEWDPPRRIQMGMGEFSPPLSRLATHFVETWEFTPGGGQTQVTRRFELHALSVWTRPTLWLIARLLRPAIRRHLRQMQRAAIQAAG